MAKINIAEASRLGLRHPRTAILLGLGKIQSGLNRYGTRQLLPPRTIIMHPTEACNMKCPMCLVGQSRDKFGEGTTHSSLSKEDIQKVANEVSSFQPIFYFSGGEPLLHPELLAVISYIHDKGMITSLVTNGWLLPEKAAGLIESGLDFISVSIDGPREVHDRQREISGSFDRAVAGIKQLVELKKQRKSSLHIKIGAVIQPSRIPDNDLGFIIDLARELEVDDVSFQHFSFYYPEIEVMNDRYAEQMHTGQQVMGMKADKADQLSAEDIDILQRFLTANQQVPVMPHRISSIHDYYRGKIPSKKSRCRSPFQHLIIRGNGDIEFCQGYVIGNIKQHRILEVWNNERARRFRHILLKSGLTPACFRCCYLEYVF